jgi:hypothetical protein
MVVSLRSSFRAIGLVIAGAAAAQGIGVLQIVLHDVRDAVYGSNRQVFIQNLDPELPARTERLMPESKVPSGSRAG